ncbi:uncharacterized protein LOC123871857 [Maniola jurtina]|uniref:uncharacterized protein LOC123871857 n=1 Tax=Maniola jurtina TaxID=191418 RepID=UPI001E68F8F6|nr:uncharacterized protein LOC123871857 [Maniola jurtina]
MKLLKCVVYGYLFYCILDDVGADFNTFIVNVRTEIESAVSTAWNSLVTAIKKPVRIRNARRKRKTTTTPSADLYRTLDQPESYQFTILDQTDADVKAINGAESNEYAPDGYKPRIPVINQPEWKSMVDWTNWQRPSLVQLIQEIRDRRRGSTVSPTDTIISDTPERTKRVNADDDEDTHFGILIFA